MTLHMITLNFLIYEENFSFLSVLNVFNAGRVRVMALPSAEPLVAPPPPFYSALQSVSSNHPDDQPAQHLSSSQGRAGL
jgi:hypothetical protein